MQPSDRYSASLERYLHDRKMVLSTPILTNMGRHPEKPLSACSAPIVNLSGDPDDMKMVIRRYQEDGMGTSFSLDNCSDPVRILLQLNEIAVENLSRKEQERPVGNIATLSVLHPKVKKFISIKAKKPDLHWKFNLSVTIPDKFFDDPNGYSSEILDEIARSIHSSGEPGVLFSDVLERNNPIPDMKYGSVATCGEIGLAPGETCVFVSIDISRFLKGEKIDYDDLRECIELSVRFLDNCLEDSIQKYPYSETSEVMKRTRKIGLGICGFSRLLTLIDEPYGSEQSIVLLGNVLSFMNYWSKQASIDLAQERGSFGSFKESSYWLEEGYLERKFGSNETETISGEKWKELDAEIKEKGLRHSTTIILPPTGRSSAVYGTTPQIEPLFSLTTPEEELIHELREHLIKHYLEKIALKARDEIGRYGSLQGSSYLSDETRRIFRTAIEIPYQEHLKVVITAQRFIDGGISKTVNLDSRSTRGDIKDIILTAHREKLNGITVYRDHTSNNQPILFGKRSGRKDSPEKDDDPKALIQAKKIDGMFCDKKHILKPKKVGEDNYLYCRICNEYYIKKNTSKPVSKGSDERMKDYVIIENISAPPDSSIRDFICPKCGHKKAYTWDRQIGYADEDPHVFTRCMMCGHTEKNTFQL